MKSCKSCGRTFSGSHYCNSKNRTVRESELDNSGDFLTSALIGAATDSAIIGGLLGGDMTGGIIGDMFDGDLFD